MRLCRFLVVAVVLFASTAVSPLEAQDAELQTAINRAIDKGVENLRKAQGEDGAWTNPGELHYKRSGLTALVGWTLLESGVDAKDGQLVKIANYLRRAALSADQTYTVSLMIMFFDKLGDPADDILIEALAIRLLRGITPYGGWSYSSGVYSIEDQKLLERAAEELRNNPPKRNPDAPRTLHPLSVRQLTGFKPQTRKNERDDMFIIGDNSNTQFATLALWVARRHGLPVDQHLALVQKRFRASVQSQGGWPYLPFSEKSAREHIKASATMTCAGLLAYAVGEGIKAKGKSNKQLLEETDVKDALKFLDEFVGYGAPPLEKMGGRGAFYYFLFSLERMAVIYDLKAIGDTDWYLWGAKQLVSRQKSDGSWPPAGEPNFAHADTCFALLFLKRANVAPDLTAGLKGIAVKAPTKKGLPKDLFDLPILIPKDERPGKEKPKENAPPPQSSLENPSASLHRGRACALHEPVPVTQPPRRLTSV